MRWLALTLVLTACGAPDPPPKRTTPSHRRKPTHPAHEHPHPHPHAGSDHHHHSHPHPHLDGQDGHHHPY